MKLQLNLLWLIPVNAVSPQTQFARISKDTIVRMVVGSADPVAPPPLTFVFADALKARGGNVQVVVLKNLGHEAFLEPAVLEQLVSLMNATSAR